MGECPTNGDSMGYFSGNVKVEWYCEDPRIMVLLETIRYEDDNGKVWTAPEGAFIDGASIPRLFWGRILDTPFIGLYRRPSVFHDIYCVNKKEPWQAVHKMFHNAMLDNGVSKTRASLMYQAVYLFGPRW